MNSQLFANLQRGDVVWQRITNGRLNVHNVICPKQTPQLFLILIDHLDDSKDKQHSQYAGLTDHSLDDSKLSEQETFQHPGWCWSDC